MILTRMQQAQEFFEKNWIQRPLPWFLLTERATTSTVGEEERVLIPDDFIEEYEGDGIWLVDENGGEHLLRKNEADFLRENEQKLTAYNTLTPKTDRLPHSYALTGKYYSLFPKPSTVYTLKQIYYGKDDALVDSSSENEWMKHAPFVLIGWAGERMAGALRDKDAFTIFRDWKAGAIGSFGNALVERENANRRMAMGQTR
jgi:hypothetical protein